MMHQLRTTATTRQCMASRAQATASTDIRYTRAAKRAYIQLQRISYVITNRPNTIANALKLHYNTSNSFTLLSSLHPAIDPPVHPPIHPRLGPQPLRTARAHRPDRHRRPGRQPALQRRRRRTEPASPRLITWGTGRFHISKPSQPSTSPRCCSLSLSALGYCGNAAPRHLQCECGAGQPRRRRRRCHNKPIILC